MRLLECFIFIFSLILIFLTIKGGLEKVNGTKYISILAFVTFLLHIIFEKGRWQLYPLYFIIIIYFICTLIHLATSIKIKKVIRSFRFKQTSIVIMIVSVIISGISSYIFPLYKIPIPKGKYEIGTQVFELIDENRKAIYSDNLENNRKINIQIWYPAQTVEGYKKAPWTYDGKIVTEALAKEIDIPSFILSHTVLVKSNSFEGAPISKALEKYPIVIISHGWTGFRNLHTDIAEELASMGYIVVGIDHSYIAQATVFNNGEVAYLNEEAFPPIYNTEDTAKYINTLYDTYRGDIDLVLNCLKKLNEGQLENIEFNSDFVDKLDLSQIGLIGHSTGGGGAVSFALKDERIKSIVGMDPWVEPIEREEIHKGLKMPSLFLRSSDWEEVGNNSTLWTLIENSKGPTEVYQINGTNHIDFAMVYMYSSITKYLKYTGELDGRITSSIQGELIGNFFNRYLKGNFSKDNSEMNDKWEEVKKIEQY